MCTIALICRCHASICSDLGRASLRSCSTFKLKPENMILCDDHVFYLSVVKTSESLWWRRGSVASGCSCSWTSPKGCCGCKFGKRYAGKEFQKRQVDQRTLLYISNIGVSLTPRWGSTIHRRPSPCLNGRSQIKGLETITLRCHHRKFCQSVKPQREIHAMNHPVNLYQPHAQLCQDPLGYTLRAW
jgi:hypothetical protein